MTTETTDTKWFEFAQNNSGGTFHFDGATGITHYVYIEAANADHAVRRANDIGIHFNGCDLEMDCPCCGDRWYKPWDEDEGKSSLSQFFRKYTMYYKWMEKGHEMAVHPLKGSFYFTDSLENVQ